MKIGVVMPTYNQAEFLDEALDSFERQTYQDRHLVVVNDGSTDSTQKIIQRRKEMRWATHAENQGTAGAINTGVSLLLEHHTDLRALSWISSDNTMRFDWLEKLVEVMETWCDVGAVYAGFHYNAPGQKPRYMFKDHEPNRLVNDVNCYYGPAFLIRREVWLEAGEHRGRISHDYDHWLRVEEVCARRMLRIIGTAHALCEYNAHDKRVTITRQHEFDAHYWQAEAKKRRGIA